MRVCYVVFCLTLLLLTQKAVAQPDLDVLAATLNYHSPLEEEAITAVQNKEATDWLKQFMAIERSIGETDLGNANRRVNELVEELKSAKEMQRSMSKRVKFVFEEVHQRFFDKYEEVAEFPRIFDEGVYNCVTATALYAIVFDKLGIDYELRSTSTHVYLIADPKGDEIVVESTDPTTGYYRLNQANQKELVRSLRQQKMISEKEYQAAVRGDEVWFNTFQGETNQLRDLVGMQYYNRGLVYTEREQWDQAASDFQKAYYYYPVEVIKSMVLMALANQLNFTATTTEQRVDRLAKFINLAEWSFEKPTEAIAAESQSMFYNVLIVSGDKEKADEVNEMLLNKVSADSALSANINFQYHFFVGYYHLEKYNPDSALINYRICYALNPKNIELQNSICNALSNKMFNGGDANKWLRMIKDFEEEFTFLKGHKLTLEFRALSHAALFEQYFRLNNASKATPNLIKFRELMAKGVVSLRMDDLIGYPYAEASAYYVRQGNFAKARKLLNEGLSYDPRNANLHRKLKALNDYEGN